jgi:hypothetical protein
MGTRAKSEEYINFTAKTGGGLPIETARAVGDLGDTAEMIQQEVLRGNAAAARAGIECHRLLAGGIRVPVLRPPPAVCFSSSPPTKIVVSLVLPL